MFYAGIDAHVKSSTIWIVDRRGRKVSSSTVMTNAEGFAAGLGRWARKGLKAAVEASGITPWICQLLKDLGAKVVVVNPNRIRLIAESRKKCDRVDAGLLAELLRLGGLPEVHQPSIEARRLRTELSVRRQLVRQRTGLVNQARGLVRGWGVILPARFFQSRGGWKDLAAKRLPEYLGPLLETMKGVYEELTRAIRQVEATLRKRESSDERIGRLETIPGVGRLSALTLVAAVDKIDRFARAKELTAYNGIVPTVRSSGEREQQGSITRQGRSEVRGVWIQAAHSLVRSRQPAALPLQTWFWKVARRRGVRTGIVALARKMLSLAFYLLRDGTQYDPLRLRPAAA
jgi:transposase